MLRSASAPRSSLKIPASRPWNSRGGAGNVRTIFLTLPFGTRRTSSVISLNVEL